MAVRTLTTGPAHLLDPLTNGNEHRGLHCLRCLVDDNNIKFALHLGKAAGAREGQRGADDLSLLQDCGLGPVALRLVGGPLTLQQRITVGQSVALMAPVTVGAGLAILVMCSPSSIGSQRLQKHQD